ncbi:Cysteine-rich protein 1, partial [Bulinus truncatus]
MTVKEAERKTSLGREWHPTCLKCHECGKVLSPGQHAEHKGLPFCHNPCYKALFGPSILGYGSNISSPANFARKDRPASHGHDYGDSNGLNEIYSGHNNKHLAKGSHPQPTNSKRRDNKV